MTLAEQVQVILEQHETELYYRTNGISPEEYPKIAERIVQLLEKKNDEVPT
jgi:hypothetical protein